MRMPGEVLFLSCDHKRAAAPTFFNTSSTGAFIAHTCEYETVRLDGTTLSTAVEGVGLGLGVEPSGTSVGAGGIKGTRTATGDTCEAGCDALALGVAAPLSHPCIATHPVVNGALCTFIRVEFINVCVTRKKMKLSPMAMPSRSAPNLRIPFHFGSRGGER